jgi:hypothetical protein
VPRAKRTDRAEARRRHRAQLDAAGIPDEQADLEAPAGSAERGAISSPAAPAPQRPSIGRAFRAAFRPVTLREDLRTFPSLLTHRSVWLPILLTVVAGVLFVMTNGANPLVAIIATYFIAPPALGSVFLAGFLAPRSSYLIGFLVGLVSAVVASAIVLSSGAALNPDGSGTGNASPSPSIVASASASPGASVSPLPSGSATASAPPAASPTPTPAATPAGNSDEQVLYAFLTSPPFGMLFASVAAWYRRFLQLSNPNRGRRPPPPRRGNDGRSRSNQRTRR